MKNNTLQSIRWENTLSIFRIIAEDGPVSRAEIADQTGLSLMTVGKTADILLSHDVAHQTKDAQPHAGRRAGALTLNDELYFIVFDYSDTVHHCTILDLGLHPIEQINLGSTIGNTDSVGFAAEITAVVKQIWLSRAFVDCCGIGICLSEDSSLMPTDITLPDDIPFGLIPVVIGSSLNAAAYSYLHQTDDFENKNILYFSVKHDRSAGAYFVCGKQIIGQNGKFCQAGKLCDDHGKVLSTKLIKVSSLHEYSEILASLLANILWILAPHTLVLDCELPSDEEQTNIFASLLSDALMNGHGFAKEELPEIIMADSAEIHTYRGLGMKVREEWLKSLLYNL